MNPISNTIINVFETRQPHLKGLSGASVITQLGIDSLGLVDILDGINDHFGVDISIRDIRVGTDMDGLAGMVSQAKETTHQPTSKLR